MDIVTLPPLVVHITSSTVRVSARNKSSLPPLNCTVLALNWDAPISVRNRKLSPLARSCTFRKKLTCLLLEIGPAKSALAITRKPSIGAPIRRETLETSTRSLRCLTLTPRWPPRTTLHNWTKWRPTWVKRALSLPDPRNLLPLLTTPLSAWYKPEARRERCPLKNSINRKT